MTTVDEKFTQAIKKLDFTRAKALLDEGVSREAIEPAIYYAARSGDAELVRRVLEGGADANRLSRPRPLEIAARSGSLEVVKVLLDHGADPSGGMSISSPLTNAIFAGSDDIAALLVRRGAEPTFRRQPVLPLAAYLGLEQTVAALLDAGAGVDERGQIQEAQIWHQRVRNAPEAERERLQDRELPLGTWDNATALIATAAAGQRLVAERLLDAGADVSAYDDAGRTPFVAARDAGHAELAAWLAQRGGGEAEKKPEEQIFEAVEAGDLESVRAHLDAGVDVDARDQRRQGQGRTLLMSAILAGEPAIAAALLEASADPALRDREDQRNLATLGCASVEELRDEPYRRGMTALHYAAAVGDAATLERLVTGGADVETLDSTRSSALMLAATNDHVPAVRALISAGADLDRPGPGRTTALHIAAGSDFIDLAKALLEAGANPNLRDSDGSTPLVEAVYGESNGMILELLEAGADPRLLDEEGREALEDAEGLEPAVVRALEKAGAFQPAGDDGDGVDEMEEELPVASPELLARYGSEDVLTRLCAGAESEAFAGVVRELAERCGSEARDRRDAIGGFEIYVPRRVAKQLDVEELQGEMLSRGAFVFASEVDIRTDFAEELVVLATTDPYDAVIVMGTNGANYDVQAPHILGWLEAAKAETPWVLTHIKYSTLSGRFLARPSDPEAMARGMYALCPDIVDQGFGEVEYLAESLGSSDRLYFWWD